ncbi:hypothetical protein BJ742DRAFT_872648 [Cladochytrium replicatum]|nr:hypothetical protein BJ742DRAFT_872648 [Cladochytrium replicatum]
MARRVALRCIEDIPVELWLQVVAFLPISALKRLRETNRPFNAIVSACVALSLSKSDNLSVELLLPVPTRHRSKSLLNQSNGRMHTQTCWRVSYTKTKTTSNNNDNIRAECVYQPVFKDLVLMNLLAPGGIRPASDEHMDLENEPRRLSYSPVFHGDTPPSILSGTDGATTGAVAMQKEELTRLWIGVGFHRPNSAFAVPIAEQQDEIVVGFQYRAVWVGAAETDSEGQCESGAWKLCSPVFWVSLGNLSFPPTSAAGDGSEREGESVTVRTPQLEARSDSGGFSLLMRPITAMDVSKDPSKITSFLEVSELRLSHTEILNGLARRRTSAASAEDQTSRSLRDMEDVVSRPPPENIAKLVGTYYNPIKGLRIQGEHEWDYGPGIVGIRDTIHFSPSFEPAKSYLRVVLPSYSRITSRTAMKSMLKIHGLFNGAPKNRNNMECWRWICVGKPGVRWWALLDLGGLVQLQLRPLQLRTDDEEGYDEIMSSEILALNVDQDIYCFPLDFT